MNSPAERRANAVIILVSIMLAIAGISMIFNPPQNATSNDLVQGTVIEKYVTTGQAFYFGLKEDGYSEKMQIEVTKDEFEKYDVGDYFARAK